MNANLANALLVLTALTAASIGAVWVSDPSPQTGSDSAETVETDSASSESFEGDKIPNPGGSNPVEKLRDFPTLKDGRGVDVMRRSYQRIASLSTVADHMLLRLVEPRRIVGVTAYTLENHPDAWRFAGIPALSTSKSLESVLALGPDLVVISKFADEAYMARLREEGIAVFDLGDMRGIATTRRDIQDLGVLLNLRERARRLEREFVRACEGLTRRIGDDPRRSGIFLSVFGDNFFGGTANTSYADLLRLAGVKDLAAERGFVGWPRFSAEQLIELDPPLIVMPKGRARHVCSHAILRDLTACSTAGGVIEMPNKNHSDAGLGLVDAAHDLQEQLRLRTPAR
ncbi:MAG: ABC transporter substrate-binding protein [Myxococcota bacterium]